MKVLLISEDTIKTTCNLDDNVSSKYLISAIVLAQDTELRTVIGKQLLEKLEECVKSNVIPNPYRELLDVYIQPYLTYQVLSEIVMPIAYKFKNFGMVQAEGESLRNTGMADVNFLRQFYTDKADVYKRHLQKYLKDNRDEFPELKECCNTNLDDATSCGIWLGGLRGKKIGRC